MPTTPRPFAPDLVVARIRMAAGGQGLFRLLATCHRRTWDISAVTAAPRDHGLDVELHLAVRPEAAEQVGRQLAKLVEVLDVEVRAVRRVFRAMDDCDTAPEA